MTHTNRPSEQDPYMAMLNRPASEFDANYESRCCGPGSVNLEPEKKVDEMEATIRLYEEEGIAKKKKKNACPPFTP